MGLNLLSEDSHYSPGQGSHLPLVSRTIKFFESHALIHLSGNPELGCCLALFRVASMSLMLWQRWCILIWIVRISI